MSNPKYPLELFQGVITVSLATMKIVKNLPPLTLKTQVRSPEEVPVGATPASLLPRVVTASSRPSSGPAGGMLLQATAN